MSRRQPVTAITRHPDPPAPQLLCPSCDQPLVYGETMMAGTRRQVERWDRFACRTCGEFEYRHRTRRLRSAEVNTIAFARTVPDRRHGPPARELRDRCEQLRQDWITKENAKPH